MTSTALTRAGRQWLTRWLTPARWVRSLAIACTVVVIVAMALSKSYISHSAIELDEPKRVAACRDVVLTRLANGQSQLDLKSLAGIHGLCYAEVNEEDILVDYGIRRSAYLNQQVQTSILLWMVVVITFSGVFLAGVQLVAAYRLASAGKAPFEVGGAVGVEKNKLSINSSVAGVLILAISLLFFYVYVHEVYLIKELVGHPPINSVAGTPDLTAGWLGTVASAGVPTQLPGGARFVAGGLGPAPTSGVPSKIPGASQFVAGGPGRAPAMDGSKKPEAIAPGGVRQ